MLSLRPYQSSTHDAIFAALDRGVKRQLVVWPTGAGKTVLFTHVIKSRGGRALILAHRDELLAQAADKVLKVIPGAHVGIVRAGLDQRHAQIVIASVQTLARERRLHRFAQNFDTLVIDEAHHAASKSYRRIIDYFATSDPLILGVTATPDREDGKGLEEIFEEIVAELSITDGIEQGWLCDIEGRLIKVANLDLSKVHTKRGDLDEKELEAIMKASNWHEHVARAFFEHAQDRPTVIFVPKVQMAHDLAAHLAAQGARAAAIDGSSDVAKRRSALVGLSNGNIQVIVNCAVLCLDAETEILTSQGWKGIDEMTPEHEVANWDDGKIFFSPPKLIIRRDRQPGERMVYLETVHRSIRVTEDHRLLWRKRGSKEFKIVHAKNCVGRMGEVPISGQAEPFAVNIEPELGIKSDIGRRISANAYALRKHGYDWDGSFQEARRRIEERQSLSFKQPVELTLDECRLIGFWIGDGTKSKLQSGGVEYLIAQSFAYPKIIEWFDGVVARSGFDYRRREYRHRVNACVHWSFGRGTGFGNQRRKGVYHLEPYLDKNGASYLWGLNQAQFDALIEGFWFADGDHGDGSQIFEYKRICNTSYELLSLLQAIAVCRGYRTNLTVGDNHKKNPNHSVEYYLGLSKRDAHILSKYTLQFEDEWRPERVWCVTSETGNIITRRRGTVTVMGNTEGFDEPSLSCVMMCRPTKSRALYTQCVGRGLRLHPNKKKCLVLDLVGLSQRLDLVNIATLAGVQSWKEGESFRQAKLRAASEAWEKERQKQAEEDAARLEAELAALRVDMLGRNGQRQPYRESHKRGAFHWQLGLDHQRSLMLSDRVVVVRPMADENWLATDHRGWRFVGGSAEECQEAAEDHGKRLRMRDPGAAWRKKRASDKQLRKLREWRIPHDPMTITAGAASDLIGAWIERRKGKAAWHRKTQTWSSRNTQAGSTEGSSL